MPSKQSYCYNCQKKVLANKEEKKQGCLEIFGHVFMCLLTGLIWLPIWILCAMYDPNKWQCTECGGKVK